MQKYLILALAGAAILCAPLGYAHSQSLGHSSNTTKKNSKFDVLNDDDNKAHEEHEQEEKKMLARRLATLNGASRYSCQLISSFSQCRQYPIDKTLSSKLKDLKESCESLPQGQFKKEACPTQNLIAQCQHIQLDYHDPQTLIYDNYYYSSGTSPWDKKDLTRICLDLEGLLVAT